MTPDDHGQAMESAIRRILDDDAAITGFWRRGYRELAAHAEDGASRWIGRRILTAVVIAITTAGLVWLVQTGALK